MIYFKKDGLNLLKSGVDKLEEAVASTMGACGSNVIINRGDNIPHITKDGVTVAKSIVFENNVENMAAKILIGAASKTCDDVGDGTTSSIVLTKAILDGAMDVILEDSNRIAVTNEIKDCGERIIEKLIQSSNSIDNVEQLSDIAIISANNDESLGKYIAGIAYEVGVDGIIKLEKSNENDIKHTITDGFKVENAGYMSHLLANNPNTMEWYAENARVLVADVDIKSVNELIPVMEECSKNNTPILLFVKSMSTEVLNLLVINKQRSGLNVCVAKIPYGMSANGYAEDMVYLCGGAFFDNTHPLKNVDMNCLGTVSKVTVGRDYISMIDTKNSTKDKFVANHIDSLKSRMEAEKDEYIKEVLRKRIAAIYGKVAIITVGAPSEVEANEKMDIIDDVIHSCKAALRSGYVIGGGMALINSTNELEKKPEKTFGELILLGAAYAPFRTIVRNSELNDEEIDLVLDSIYDSKNNMSGYNAKKHYIVQDMIKEGIIDPTDVVVSSLRNAISSACSILTTSCVIS